MRKNRIVALAGCLIMGFCGGCGGGNITPKIPDTKLVDYESYRDKQNISITAWDFPELEYDAANGFDTERNNAIIEDMVAANIDILNLTGRNSLYVNNSRSSDPKYLGKTNMELTKEQIALCNKHGIKTVAFGPNTGGDNENVIYSEEFFPDFSDCEGFYGFMPWDEPLESVMGKLGNYARIFNNVYAGTDAVFHVNLLPSYGAPFVSGGFDYESYLERYCETVLSEVAGTKWLMVDSYPVMSNGELWSSYLFDLLMLKTYALEYGAFSQLSILSTATEASMNARTPDKEEMATEAFTALAFGMDGLAWYTYSTPRLPEDADGKAPVKLDGTKTEHYYDLKAVNDALKAFGHVYKCFEWRGVILNGRKQTAAMNFIKRNTNVNEWVLDPSDTKSLKSVACKDDYIIGVMKDARGNDGFMVVNYSDKKTHANINMEFEFTNINYLRVYKNGTMEDLSVADNKITLPLQYGEGAFIIPYYKNTI